MIPCVVLAVAIISGISAIPVNNPAEYLLNSCVQHLPTTVTFSQWRCQIGQRGPCDQGQIFKSIPPKANYRWIDISSQCPLERPSHCQDADVQETYDRQEPLDEVQEHHGVCLWADRRHPCRGFPSGFRFNADEQKCQMADVSGHSNCADGFTFYSVNNTHGQCQCRGEFGIWPVDGKCYRTHSQGPCGENEWLSRGSDGELSCQSIKCQIKGNQLDWPTERGVSCKANEEMADNFESLLQYSFECSYSVDSPSLGDNFECNSDQIRANDNVVFCYREEHTETSFLLLCPQTYE